MEFLIEKAKKQVEKTYGDIDRRWLEPSPVNFVIGDTQRVRFFVREGSPCKGIVIANYGLRKISKIDAWGKSLGKISVDECDLSQKDKVEFYKFKKQLEEEQKIKIGNNT